jgi:deoxyribose-phosphate aldolase
MAPSDLAARVRTPGDLAPLIDHTLLAEAATADEVERLCEEALRHRFAAVCVRAGHAALARRRLQGSGVRLALVVDFPRGEATTAARVAEAVAAAGLGADELDLVAPLPLLVAGRWSAAHADLVEVIVAAAVPVKVILETAALGEDAVVAAAAVARAAGAAMLKTSTGFGPGGATVEAVALLRRVAGEAIGVKASGGIRTAAQALAMVRAGASRIGASASVAIVEGDFAR